MPNSSRRHLFLSIFKFGLIGCMMVWLSQIYFGLPFRKSHEFAPNSLSQRSDGLYVAKHKNFKSYLAGAVHQRMDFTENKSPLGSKLSSAGQVRRASGAAWFVAASAIYFRLSDGTDPRNNGRVYAASLPWVPPAWLCWMLLPATFAVVSLSLQIQRGSGLWRWLQELKQRGAFTPPKLAETFVLAAIALAFLMPLGLTAWRSYVGPERAAAWPWISNLTLPDRVDDRPKTAFSLQNLWTGKWQHSTSTAFNEDFAGREACVRATSEVWASVFRAPTAAASKVRFLEDGHLIETSYLEEYYLSRTTADKLRPLVLKLKQFQDLCDQRKLPVILVLTPSKVPHHLDHIPAAWKERNRPGLRGVDLFQLLLTEMQVRYVDGIALTRDHGKRTSWPLFPRGGIHWAPETAWQTTSAVIHQLSLSWTELPLPPPPTISTSPYPTGEEWDLEYLLTLSRRWESPVDAIQITPVPSANALPSRRLVAIGGSFTGKLMQQLVETRLVTATDWFFYYEMRKITDQPSSRFLVRSPAGPVDLRNEIFSASAILLEANESLLIDSGPVHLNEFLDDGLAFLRARQ